MVSIKNKDLNTENMYPLCKIHNGNNNSKEKSRLYTFRNQKFIKTYHPLKQKKVKLRKLKFTSGTAAVNVSGHLNKEAEDKIYGNILSRRYRIMPIDHFSSTEWADENTVITWLISIGIEIKQISSTQYLLKNRICLFNNVLIFANKKRVERGLSPFYISSILEY